MKKSILIALIAAMPLIAQECPVNAAGAPVQPCTPAPVTPAAAPSPVVAEEERAEEVNSQPEAAKVEQPGDAARNAQRAIIKAKFMERFDANKDGQISEAELDTVMDVFEKSMKRGFKGPRRPMMNPDKRAEMLAKFDADKDGKLNDEERQAARSARRAAMKARFMEKFDSDKDGQISDAEREAAKAEFMKNRPHHFPCGPCGHRPHGFHGHRHHHGFHGHYGPRHHHGFHGHHGPRRGHWDGPRHHDQWGPQNCCPDCE